MNGEAIYSQAQEEMEKLEEQIQLAYELPPEYVAMDSALLVNSIFHTNNKNSILTERNLYKDLIKEAIQIYGHDVYYVDRTLVARDNVLGEDVLSKVYKCTTH